MMFRIKLLIFVVFTFVLVFPGIKVSAEENKAAVIYDTYNEFGSEENKLNSLVQLILSTGSGVDIININSYSDASMDKYKTIFIMYNNSSVVPDNFVQKLLNSNGKIMWIGKNFNGILQTSKNIKYIPNLSFKDENYSSLRKSIYEFINNSSWKNKNVYLLIDKVYPFIDLNSFMDKVDFLHDQGISFICSIMPVYENENFDAMNRFCEVLRYAQSKGGKIILHSSILDGENISGKDVENKMGLAQQIYIKHGVYPLALDLADSFLYKEDYKGLVHSSNSIFVDKDKQIGILDLKKYSIDGFTTVIDKVDFNDEYMYKTSENNYNIALSFNSDLNLNTFKNEVNSTIDKKVYFSDVENLNAIIKLGGMELKSDNSNILLNNKSVGEENHVSKSSSKDQAKDKIIDMSNANGKIIKITIAVCFIFIIIVLISTRIDRRKFFNYRG